MQQLSFNGYLANHISHDYASNVSQILASFVSFNTLLLVLRSIASSKYDKSVRREIVNKIISSVHAILVTFMSLKILLLDNEFVDGKLIFKSLEISFTLNIVIGYMLYDVTSILRSKELFDPMMILHHFLSALAFHFCALTGAFSYIAIFRLTSEASTVFIHIRWFLEFFKRKSSVFYKVNGLAIVVVFTTFRIVTIPLIWSAYFKLMLDPDWTELHFALKCISVITSFPLDIMNLYWFSRIIRGALKLFVVPAKPENKLQ